MSNLSKTQLSFEFLSFTQKNFSELFNGLSSRDKNSFKNSQSGTELNVMFDFLCNVLGKKVVEEKKSRKNKNKTSENVVNETVVNEQNLNVQQSELNNHSTPSVQETTPLVQETTPLVQDEKKAQRNNKKTVAKKTQSTVVNNE